MKSGMVWGKELPKSEVSGFYLFSLFVLWGEEVWLFFVCLVYFIFWTRADVTEDDSSDLFLFSLSSHTCR